VTVVAQLVQDIPSTVHFISAMEFELIAECS
jgi:hypothetical protein